MGKLSFGRTTLIIGLFFLINCTSNSDQELLVGTWNAESIIRLADSSKAPQMDTKFEFKETGEFLVQNMVLIEAKGTWQLEGNELSLTQGLDSGTSIMTIDKLTDTELVWRTNPGNTELLFTLKKIK